MTQRLHPEDLRTIVAAIYDASPNAIHRPNVGIEKADHLLKLLAKTAKPEAEPDAMTFQLERDMLAWRQKAWENATRAETAEARIKELEAELLRLRHIAEGPWTRSQLVAEVDRLNTALQTAHAEAAREEREARGFGPREIKEKTRLTCEGCPACKLEPWEDYLENDDRDSGTSVTCTVTGQNIACYWNPRNPPPGWCPGMATKTEEGDQTEPKP